jgi:hypothetical protein
VIQPGTMAALHELRRLLSGEIEAACGVRSSYGGFLEYKELGCRVDSSFHHREFALDDTSAQLRLLAKLRPATRALQGLPGEQQRILRAAFGPEGPERPVELEAFTSAVYAHPIGGVVALTDLARRRHSESRSSRGFIDWLQRLSGRHSGRLDGGNRDQRRRDAVVAVELAVAGEQLLHPTVDAYVERWKRWKTAERKREEGADAA